jgi:hypothetical protein
MIAKTEINSHKKVYSNIRLKITRGDGTVRKVVSYDGHSLVANFWKAIYGSMKDIDSNFTDINGNSVSTQFQRYQFGCAGGPGSSLGLIVGSDATTLSVNDTKLPVMINHGLGVGELDYKANSITTDLHNRKATITRSFENLSGGTITVKDVGLTSTLSTAIASPCLIARDVLPIEEDILATESLSVSYDVFFTNGNINYQNIFTCIKNGSFDNWINTNGNPEFYAYIGFNCQGILVGNGDNPLAINDFKLANVINAGSAAGELDRGGVFVSNFKVDDAAGTLGWEVSRGFTNNTPGPIPITEMGLFGGRSNDTGLWMIDRIVLPAPVTIRPGEQRQAKWLFRYAI